MGGKALKVKTRRYDREEYYLLEKEVLDILYKNFHVKLNALEAFKHKETFGDMDILVMSTNITYNFKQKIQDVFKPQEIFQNSNVYSFDYKELQIDLILTDEKYWNTSINFFKFNDLGNLIGKIFYRFDLKYGQKGLVYVYRTFEERFLGEIIISQDMEKILNFIGLDYNRWKQGFQTAEEVFEFIISSKYFDADSFKLENLNAINRKRNKKRKMYGEFISYCEKTKPISKFTFNPDKTVYREKIEQHFPGFFEQLKKLEKLEAHQKMLREKFNGELVMQQFPELKGPALGKALGEFKLKMSPFEEYVEANTPEKIMSDFKEFVND